MKKIAIFLIMVLPLFFCGCDSNNDAASSSTVQVGLNISKSKVPANLAITYKAVSTGDGKITQLTYLDDKAVIQTVSNPTLPWVKTISILADSSVAMTASGTIAKGSLTISVDGIATGTTFHLEDSKSHE